MKQLDYGKGYRYAHDEAGGYAAGVRYFPDGMEVVNFYQPTERGLEGKISEKLAHSSTADDPWAVVWNTRWPVYAAWFFRRPDLPAGAG